MTQIVWRCNEDYCGIIRKLAPLPMENLLASWSKTGTESFTDPKNLPTGPGYGGTGDESELNSKEHWGSIDSWDSWE